MKLLVVDDHALFREGLCHVLEGMQKKAAIVEAADYDSATALMANNLDPDLILLDLQLPGKDGFTLLEFLSREYPATPVVILSASSDRDDMQRALKAGAMGFIPKETTSKVLLNALQLILSGEVYVPAHMMLIDQRQQDATVHTTITSRQNQVLSLMALGHSNKAIAKELDVAEATVKMHVTSILKLLGVKSRTQAVVLAEKKGMLNKSESSQL